MKLTKLTAAIIAAATAIAPISSNSTVLLNPSAVCAADTDAVSELPEGVMPDSEPTGDVNGDC